MKSCLVRVALTISLIGCFGCKSRSETLTIDYANSIEQAIVLAHIDVVDSQITSETFHKTPSEVGKKYFSSHVFTYSTFVSAESVKADMQADGFRAATAYELFAYANIFPTKENDNLIALGTVWTHEQESNVIALRLRKNGRILSLFNCRLQISPLLDKGLFGTNSWFLGLKEIPFPPASDAIPKK